MVKFEISDKICSIIEILLMSEIFIMVLKILFFILERLFFILRKIGDFKCNFEDDMNLNRKECQRRFPISI